MCKTKSLKIYTKTHSTKNAFRMHAELFPLFICKYTSVYKCIRQSAFLQFHESFSSPVRVAVAVMMISWVVVVITWVVMVDA